MIFFRRAVLVVFLVLGSLVGAKEPSALYLTWVKDPTTTMTILWHTPEKQTSSKLMYQKKGDVEWKEGLGVARSVKSTHILVHRVDLEGLMDGSDYLFKIEEGGREYHFRTMPKTLNQSVKFAMGGDVYYYWGTEVFQRMSRMIGYHDPDFVVIGGDLAYTTGKKRVFKGRKWEIRRWQTFLKEIQRNIKGADGRLIPFLPIVGNHDIRKSSSKPQMFYELFAFPEAGKSYRSLDFGEYLSLVMLDTGHTDPIEGEQTAWLEQELKARAKMTYLFTAYHVGAYPSYYPYLNHASATLRKFWSPLFEKYGVPFAFEHHNHCYKRTHPIKEEKVDPAGVVYLGDGSWGVSPRKSHEKLWYMEKVESVNACYIITLTPEQCLIEAKDSKGHLVDKVVAKPRLSYE